MQPAIEMRAVHDPLVNRILPGPGQAPADLRGHAFDNAGLPEPLRPFANAFAFDVLTQEGFEAGTKYLLKRGYQ
jgi:hypothetical protein